MITERVSEGSLFERIRDAAYPSARRPKAALLHSLCRNLRDVLNTRSGSCHGSPELGISDFNNDSPMTSDAASVRERLVKAIQDCILNYEPRISTVTVSAVVEDPNAPLDLRFHIVATLNFNTRRDVLEFDILLDNHQHWRVE